MTLDDSKVECVIIQPQENDTLKLGATISIAAEVDYSKGTIIDTRFFVDGVVIDSSTESLYRYEWETANSGSGWHKLRVEAKANDGAIGLDEKDILLVGEVTVANAGNDTIIEKDSIKVTLNANEPEFDYEAGLWRVVSGTGGSFEDPTYAHTVFTGMVNSTYILEWQISNKYAQSKDSIQIIFRKVEYGSVVDIDGNTYKTVKIGNQEWMAENLKVTREPDGTPIPYLSDGVLWDYLEDNNTDKAYCYYNNDVNSPYGLLYTFAAAANACPAGWHLPTNDEWVELIKYVKNDGHWGTEADALKSTRKWEGFVQGTDNYDFTALPGGYRNNSAEFYSVGYGGFWWSATEYSIYAYIRNMSYTSSVVNKYYYNKSYGFSVRCVKD